MHFTLSCRWGEGVTLAVYRRFIACQTRHVVYPLKYNLDSPSGAWIVLLQPSKKVRGSPKRPATQSRCCPCQLNRACLPVVRLSLADKLINNSCRDSIAWSLSLGHCGHLCRLKRAPSQWINISRPLHCSVRNQRT